jgi:hypothetical protein
MPEVNDYDNQLFTANLIYNPVTAHPIRPKPAKITLQWFTLNWVLSY